MFENYIPQRLRDTIERVHGEAGRRWLATLPTLLSECRARFSLELHEPFENLSYNLVLPGRTSDETEIVLKLGVPCRELLTEAATLDLFQGQGTVRLLAQDAPRGILLLERISPGTPLHKLQGDAEAAATAAKLMCLLWRAPPSEHPLPSLADWFLAFARLRHRFGGDTGPFAPDLIARAERTFAELNASSGNQVVIHGDLHHDNILFSAERGWVAIDPKGIVGDRGYEVASFMLNQLPIKAADSETMEILSRRLSIFSAQLNISRERLARWSFCHAVLSALWDFEESAEWDETIRLAQLFERLG